VCARASHLDRKDERGCRAMEGARGADVLMLEWLYDGYRDKIIRPSLAQRCQ
jgi:hypothetical protein